MRFGHRKSLLVLILVLAAAGIAGVLAQTPARNGNVYNGTAHQPDAGSTSQDEKAAGIALPPDQQKREIQELEQLNQQTLGKAQQDESAGHATCGSVAANC